MNSRLKKGETFPILLPGSINQEECKVRSGTKVERTLLSTKRVWSRRTDKAHLTSVSWQLSTSIQVMQRGWTQLPVFM